MEVWRRSLSGLLLSFVVGTAAPLAVPSRGAVAAQPASPQALTKVRFQEVVHALFFLPQYVAQANGYFREEGLDVQVATAQGADRACRPCSRATPTSSSWGRSPRSM